MKLNQLLFTAVGGMLLAFSVPAQDSDADRHADLEALKQQIQELNQKVQALEQRRDLDQPTNGTTAQEQIQDLDQKVRILARQRELDQEAAVAAAKTAPKLSVGAGGFSAMSADSNFVFSLKGVVQVDSRTFFNDGDIKNNDGFLLRRARPIFQGTVDRDFDFRIMPDFGGSSVQLYDAYGNYRYHPWAQLRAGKFKTPEGLEQLQEDIYTSFNERSLVTDLVPNRDVGIAAVGRHPRWCVELCGRHFQRRG